MHVCVSRQIVFSLLEKQIFSSSGYTGKISFQHQTKFEEVLQVFVQYPLMKKSSGREGQFHLFSIRGSIDRL